MPYVTIIQTPSNHCNNGGGRHIWQGGGIDRASRRICVISAAASVPPAVQFSGNTAFVQQQLQYLQHLLHMEHQTVT